MSQPDALTVDMILDIPKMEDASGGGGSQIKQYVRDRQRPENEALDYFVAP